MMTIITWEQKHLLSTGKEACIIHWIRLYFVIFWVILIFTDLKPGRINY